MTSEGLEGAPWWVGVTPVCRHAQTGPGLCSQTVGVLITVKEGIHKDRIKEFKNLTHRNVLMTSMYNIAKANLLYVCFLFCSTATLQKLEWSLFMS